MNTFREDLSEAAAYHGHICSGQIVGVRMARLGLRLLGISDPKTFRELIVYVECDRCLTDAISTVTGCKLGKRSLKWMDYGKSAATFLNLQTGKALRIYRKTHRYPPEGAELIEFFESIPDSDMFSTELVHVHYDKTDLPGKPLDAIICSSCGEEVIDGRQQQKDGVYMCRACAFGSYYDRGAEI